MPADVRGVVRVKPGVTFTRIAPAGFRLLAAIEATARTLAIDLTVTSACDGEHSGPGDPHPLGRAYDVRTQGLTPAQQDAVLTSIIGRCIDTDESLPRKLDTIPRSLASRRFFGFVEAPGTPNEHIHVQLRRGTDYP